jgi:hypothetical protein
VATASAAVRNVIKKTSLKLQFGKPKQKSR